jgi:type IV secretion system protein VirB9
LQPGEIVTGPPDLSDARWIVHPRLGTEDGQRVMHVIVKPSDTGLDGNIVLHTDRRTYSIGLVSREREWMPLVKFDYPEDRSGLADSWGTHAAWPMSSVSASSGSTSDDPCDGTPLVPPSGFKVSGPRRSWTPVQVYVVSSPVGQKTCIEFASDMGSRALPSLVALANDGGWFSDPTPQIVNFRYEKRRYIVDEALDHFAVVSGVGDDQEKNEIRRVTP